MSVPSVTIFFEGRSVPCRPDATVAVALWEHGVRVLSHSSKYGRPRGLHCARGGCMSCLMRIDGVPNVRSCSTPVRDGMRVERQDSGSVYGAPMQKVLNATGHLMPVGFYYKWFTKPAVLNDVFMKTIRPLTGIGRLPEPAPESPAAAEPEARDLGRRGTLIVGGGLAGLDEALTADRDALLVDDHPEPGGQRRAALDLAAAHADGLLDGLPRLAALKTRLDERREAFAARGVEFLHASAVGAWQPDMLLLRDEHGLAVVRADRIVWAAGALDAFPLFDDRDVPGVLGPRALYRLVAQQGMKVAGLRAVVHGHGPDAALSAAVLHAAGARVTLALDAAADPDGALLETAQRLGWSPQTDLAPSRARTRDGVLSALEFAGGHGGAVSLPCRLAVIADRAKPMYDVPYQLGVDLTLDPARGGYVPTGDADRVRVRGEAAGETLDVLCEEVSA